MPGLDSGIFFVALKRMPASSAGMMKEVRLLIRF
jgi:hypothetical protein